MGRLHYFELWEPSCQVKFEPRPRRALVITEGEIHQVLIWFEMTGQDGVSLVSSHVEASWDQEGQSSFAFAPWSLSATLW